MPVTKREEGKTREKVKYARFMEFAK